MLHIFICYCFYFFEAAHVIPTDAADNLKTRETYRKASRDAKVQHSIQKALGRILKIVAEGESLYSGKEFQAKENGLLSEGDITTNHRYGFGTDAEERGNGIEWQVLYDAGTTL